VVPTDGNSSYVREMYGSPGDRAVPRGSRPNPGAPAGADGRVAPTDVNSSYVREMYDSPRDRGVPRGSRPNPGAPTVGQAVLRPNQPIHGGGGGGNGGWYPYYPYFPYYGWGLGLGYYGWYDPWWYWGAPLYVGDGYGYGYYGSESGGRGGLKLKVEPTFAEVYVDGYYMGIVDDFDGTFQRMELEVGPHRIEIRAPGHETLGFDVRIEFGDTVTFRGVLQPLLRK